MTGPLILCAQTPQEQELFDLSRGLSRDQQRELFDSFRRLAPDQQETALKLARAAVAGEMPALPRH